MGVDRRPDRHLYDSSLPPQIFHWETQSRLRHLLQDVVGGLVTGFLVASRLPGIGTDLSHDYIEDR